MNEEKLAEFNKELKALLDKYQVVLRVEEVPATTKMVVVPKEAQTTGTDDKPTK